MVPLANMFGYVNQLRSFTQGRAQYSMQFSHYDEVPAERRRRSEGEAGVTENLWLWARSHWAGRPNYLREEEA